MIDWFLFFHLCVWSDAWIVSYLLGLLHRGAGSGDAAYRWLNILSRSAWQMVPRYISLSLQLVLSVATADMAAQNSNSTLLLPSPTHVINIADRHDRAAFSAATQMKEEPMDVDGYDISSPDVSYLLSSSFLMTCLSVLCFVLLSVLLSPALCLHYGSFTLSLLHHFPN